jgi:hypothetical protein
MMDHAVPTVGAAEFMQLTNNIASRHDCALHPLRFAGDLVTMRDDQWLPPRGR